MTGTILNVLAVLLGGGLGVWFGARLPERVRSTVLSALGLVTLALGVQMFLNTHNALVVLGSVLAGGIVGEGLRLDDRLRALGAWLEARFAGGSGEATEGNRFIRGFVTASLVFCIGPMTILGAIQDGLNGDYQLLSIKSVLDGFAALAFASSLGVGVLFSTLTILIYQGSLSLLASQAQAVFTVPMMDELTAVGGVLILGIAIGNLLELKPIRVASYLPALVIAPALVAVLQSYSVGGY